MKNSKNRVFLILENSSLEPPIGLGDVLSEELGETESNSTIIKDCLVKLLKKVYSGFESCETFDDISNTKDTKFLIADNLTNLRISDFGNITDHLHEVTDIIGIPNAVTSKEFVYSDVALLIYNNQLPSLENITIAPYYQFMFNMSIGNLDDIISDVVGQPETLMGLLKSKNIAFNLTSIN